MLSPGASRAAVIIREKEASLRGRWCEQRGQEGMWGGGMKERGDLTGFSAPKSQAFTCLEQYMLTSVTCSTFVTGQIH